MTNATNAKTALSELGEFGLIRRLTENIVLKNESTLKGVGDDCAVLDFKNKKIVVLIKRFISVWRGLRKLDFVG